MQINTAIYYYDYKHVHTPAANPSAWVTFRQARSRCPAAEMIGFETDVLWLVSDRVTLGATVSATHSEYTADFDVIDTNNAQRPQSLFDPSRDAVQPQGQPDAACPGEEVRRIRSVRAPDERRRGTLTFLADYSWIDKVYFSLFEERTDAAPSYSRVDPRITWLSSGENWTVSAFCNNVFDDIGIRQIEALTEADNFRRTGTLTNPRTYGVEVAVQVRRLEIERRTDQRFA